MMTWQVVIPLRREPLSVLEAIPDYNGLLMRLLLAGERADVRLKLYELLDAVNEAIRVSGGVPHEPALDKERECVIEALRRVLSSKTSPKLIECIVEDLREELCPIRQKERA